MKTIIFIAFISLSLLIFGACQTATDTTKTDGKPAASESPKSDDTSASTKADEKKEDEKSVATLKPEDIDLEKPFAAKELNASFLADEAAWKGKEVSVIGKYHSTTTSTIEGKERIRVDIADAETNKKQVGCVVSKKVPEEVSKERTGRVFRGKVLEERYGRILLEPCEFVK